VPAERLGVCDAHDHPFFGTPRLPDQELQSVSAARAELAAFRAQGGEAVVQWTPYGLGRRAADLPASSAAAPYTGSAVDGPAVDRPRRGPAPPWTGPAVDRPRRGPTGRGPVPAWAEAFVDRLGRGPIGSMSVPPGR
jgi:hypothetical protein